MPRDDLISWDEYYMGLASLSAKRSKDPNTQVGACIVHKDGRVLSLGYNGSPNKFSDDKMKWEREGSPLETKYLYMVHAEANAISNYRGSSNDFEHAKIYVTLFPCNECAKLIIQNRIKEVIYLDDKYINTDANTVAKTLFNGCNVKYRQYKKSDKCIKIDL